MAKRRRKKKRPPPQPKRGGDLVRAVVVAETLGLDARTVRGYVERRVWGGKRIGTRVYVFRSVFESLRDPGSPDVSLG